MAYFRLFSSLFLSAELLTLTRAYESDFLHVMTMNDAHKQQFVDAHNHYRRNVSKPEAANMRLMTWDEGLAALAEKVVKTCRFDHTADGERKTNVFNPAGENIYAGGNFRFSEIMSPKGVTELWYSERQWYDHSTLTCAAGKVCGHYTQIVWAKSYKVGCAIGKCGKIEGGFSTILVSCNYGPAGNENLYGAPKAPFVEGTPCSKCDEGDSCVDQLCSNAARDRNIPFTTPQEIHPTTDRDRNIPLTTPQAIHPTTARDRNIPFTTPQAIHPTTARDRNIPFTTPQAIHPTTAPPANTSCPTTTSGAVATRSYFGAFHVALFLFCALVMK